MIIELFGAPGSGKTTFAHNLAERLRARGYQVGMLLSLRPDEGDARRTGRTSSLAAAAMRLIRPIDRLMHDVRRAALHGAELDATWRLLRAMPPRGPLWSIRLYRYALHLNCAWPAARQTSHPVLVDQGFVQLLGSLAVLSGTTDLSRIANLLRIIPAPDLLIRVQASDETLRHRLEARLAGQGWLERRLEFPVEENLRLASVLGDLCLLLRQSCREVISLCSTDMNATARIATIIEERLALQQAGGFRDVESSAYAPSIRGVG